MKDDCYALIEDGTSFARWSIAVPIKLCIIFALAEVSLMMSSNYLFRKIMARSVIPATLSTCRNPVLKLKKTLFYGYAACYLRESMAIVNWRIHRMSFYIRSTALAGSELLSR